MPTRTRNREPLCPRTLREQALSSETPDGIGTQFRGNARVCLNASLVLRYSLPLHHSTLRFSLAICGRFIVLLTPTGSHLRGGLPHKGGLLGCIRLWQKQGSALHECRFLPQTNAAIHACFRIPYAKEVYRTPRQPSQPDHSAPYSRALFGCRGEQYEL